MSWGILPNLQVLILDKGTPPCQCWCWTGRRLRSRRYVSEKRWCMRAAKTCRSRQFASMLSWVWTPWFHPALVRVHSRTSKEKSRSREVCKKPGLLCCSLWTFKATEAILGQCFCFEWNRHLFQVTPSHAFLLRFPEIEQLHLNPLPYKLSH